MKILYSYLKQYKGLLALALVLATINQSFSLMDPWLFGKMVDGYIVKAKTLDFDAFFKGAGLLLLAMVGVAFVSRVAKNFQDYFANVIVQKMGAKMYTDGLGHSLELPYQVFEDQRSGETLGKLQKERADVEKLITAFINTLFTSLIGIVFVTDYAIRVHWII